MKKIRFLVCFLLLSPYAFSEERAPSKDLPPEEKTATKDPELSKVDGQIVPVGTKNDYEYKYRKINIGSNLFQLPSDIVSLSGSYAFHQNLAVRVGGKLDYSDGGKYQRRSNNSLFAGLPIYFRKVYTGVFVEPGYDSHAGIYVAGGYHWMWDSGFNIYAGIGTARKTGGTAMLQISYAFDL